MPKITVLTEDVINKIAAGEVIERPASVVKELIENSLDAKAKQIVIEIKDSGKGLIKVSDNGEGMDEEDARKSILRHSTSKIRQTDDLFSISTLGFRGEALASIAAVSRLSIRTKLKNVIEGFSLVVEGGRVIDSGITATGSGTTIKVNDLFFNTPARKKFMKTDQVELRHIIDVVTRYSLINPTVSWKLIHNGNELISSPSVSDLKSNIASVYGFTLAKELLEVNYCNEFITINGYIAPPSHIRNDRSQQAIFVNNRWVRNDDITKAIYDAYHSLLFVNKHPIVVLNIMTDPKCIDVNVHPSKLDIKFDQKDEIYKSVFEAVRGTFQQNQLIPTVDAEFEQQVTFFSKTGKENRLKKDKKQKEKKQEEKYIFEPSRQTVFKERSGMQSGVGSSSDELYADELSVDELSVDELSVDELSVDEPSVTEHQKAANITGTEKFPAMKLLGQVHKTFFIAETEGGAFFIDQHAVHERILYDQFMEQLMNKHVEVQHLLKGDILELTPTEKATVLEHQETLQFIGFTFESFGENTFVIKTIPSLFGRLQPKETVYDILHMLQLGKNKTEQIQEEIITRMACRSAVMAGDTLTISEMENYLNELAQRKLPYTCPHGRPTMFKISVDELEKKFRRK